MKTRILNVLRGGLEKYAMPPESVMQSPANPPAATPKAPTLSSSPSAVAPIKPVAPATGTWPGMTIQDADANARQKMWTGLKNQVGLPNTQPQPTNAPTLSLASTPPAAQTLVTGQTTTPTQPAVPVQAQTPPVAPQASQPQPVVSGAQAALTDTAGQALPTTPQPATPEQPKPAPVEIPDSVKAWGSAPSGPGGSSGPSVEQFSAVSKQLSDSKIPAQQRQQFAHKFLEQHVQSNPELVQGLRDAQAGKDTPAAQAYNAKLKSAENDYVQQRVQQQADAAVKQNPELAKNPQSFGDMLGGFAQNAMDSFNNMPMPMKLMLGIGLPMGLVGVMSSLFGEGGMGMGLMGVLGLGAAGLAGASGGMFGQGAQNAVTDGLFNLGQAAGMIPQVDPKDLAILKEKDPLAAMANRPVGTREEIAQQLKAVPGQIANLRQLQMVPEGMRARFLQRLDPSMSADEAQRAVQNAGSILTAYDNPQSDLRTKMQQGQAYADTRNQTTWQAGLTGLGGAMMDQLPSDWRTWVAQKASYDTTVAKKLAYQYDLQKAARCWAGYEPVPGAKAYSRGSCRPVGSKKTQKEMKSGKERHHEETKQSGAQSRAQGQATRSHGAKVNHAS